MSALPLRAMFEQASDGIAIMDDTQTIIAMNPALERITGYAAGVVVGRAVCRTILACKDETGALLCDRPCPGQQALCAGVTTPDCELFLTTKQGDALPVSASFTPLRLEPDGRRVFLMITRDITDKRRREQHLRRLAMTDSLTGLPNRRSLTLHLRREVARAQRYHHPLSLLFIDLDHFKRYNDRRGHRRGDAVLVTIGRLLKAQLRESDTAARYGGEEFVVLLPETDTPRAGALAEGLRQVVQRQLGASPGSGGRRVGLTVSVGVATLPADAQNGTALLERADRALYAAKAAGRNRVQCYAPAMTGRKTSPPLTPAKRRSPLPRRTPPPSKGTAQSDVKRA
jgi:diguanylate cyclase (GGDEF)-like protein/PAS domain S-box-containing protein